MAAIGSPSVPVYIDENGAAKPCTSITPGGSGGGSTVVGSIVPYGGTDTPDGFLYCDGSEVSKESYADLYAVIGNTFGTATDPLKFKLPKINDARYLQGNTTPGTSVDAGLPNITGTFGNCEEQSSEINGAFTEIPTTGGAAPGVTSNNGQNISFSAADSNDIYGKSDTVTPKSVTVRYLICWKKTIAKVDTLISVPDWSSKVKYDLSSAVKSSYAKTYGTTSITFTRMMTFTATEPGFINAMSMADVATSQGSVEVNGVLVDINMDSDAVSGYESNFVPVDTGDVVTLYSTENDYLKRWVDYYPAKATPSKLYELYMGAPDYSATWDNFLTLAGGAKSTGGTYNVEANGFIRVYAGNNNYGASASSGWSMKINDKSVVENYCSITDVPELNSIVPVSKGDVVTWTAITAGSAGGVTFDFIPRKKIQVDGNDIIATGKGGVIDGSLCKDATEVEFAKASTSSVKENVQYTTDNDCLLVIRTDGTDFAEGNYGANVFVNGAFVGTLLDTFGGSYNKDFPTLAIPVKKGSKITFDRITGTNKNIWVAGTGTIKVTFYEYKLIAINPQIAIPDFNEANGGKIYTKSQTFTAAGYFEWTATENCYVSFRCENTKHCRCYIKAPDDTDFRPSYATGIASADSLICGSSGTFVEKGTICRAGVDDSGIITLSAYRLKSIQQSNDTPYVIERKRGTSDNGSVWWYTLWSDGYCEQGGRVVDPVSDVSGGGTYVTLPKPYIDLNYTVNMSTCGYRSTDPKNATYISSVWFEKTRFVAIANGTVLGFTWRAEGYVT